MTKREHVPIDYDPRIDRRQPPPLGCVKMLGVAVVGLAALVFVGVGVAAHLANQNSSAPLPTVAALPTLTSTLGPTASPTDAPPAVTSTPDEWSLTGTALANATVSPTPTASATMDYCWFLTPSPTPTATLPYTPDAWQATGTAIYEATHPYQTPTPQPPRELCVELPTWTPVVEETTEVIVITSVPESTEMIIATWIAETLSAQPATATPQPQLPQRPSNVSSSSVRVVTEQVEIVVTAPPPPPPPPQQVIVTAPPVQIVVTATPYVPDASWYATETQYFATVAMMLTQTMAAQQPPVVTTEAPALTDEPTATPTATLEPTATATATPSPTATATATPTATLEPTATDVPTEPPEPPTTEESTDA